MIEWWNYSQKDQFSEKLKEGKKKKNLLKNEEILMENLKGRDKKKGFPFHWFLSKLSGVLLLYVVVMCTCCFHGI